jgi:hypothetical protein
MPRIFSAPFHQRQAVGKIAHQHVTQAAIEKGLREAGVQRLGPAERVQSLVQPLCILQGQATAVPGIGIAGIKSQGAIVALDGLAVTQQQREGIAAAEPGRRIIRIDRQRAVIGRERLVQPFQVVQHIAQIGQRQRIARIGLDHRRDQVIGLPRSALLGFQHAKHVAGVHQVGICRQNAIVNPFGFLQAALAMQRHPLLQQVLHANAASAAAGRSG